MTQPTPTTTPAVGVAHRVKVASPHKPPAVAAAIGTAIGVLTLLEGFFGSGHVPTGVQIASVLAGSGLSLGSVGAFVAAHISWLKAAGPAVAAAFPAVEDAVKAVPGLAERVAQVEQTVQHAVTSVAPGVDVAAVAAEVKRLIVDAAVSPTPHTPAAAAAAATAPAGPVGSLG